MRTFFAALIAAALVLSPGLSEAKRGDDGKGKKMHKQERPHKKAVRKHHGHKKHQKRSHFSFSYGGHYPDYYHPYYGHRGHYGPRAGVYFNVSPGFGILFQTGPRYSKHHYYDYPRHYNHGPRYYRHHKHYRYRY